MADVTINPTDLVVGAAGVGTPTNITDNDTAVSSGNNYYTPNNGKVIYIITNGAGSNTATLETPITSLYGLAITDLAATLTASKTYGWGPFPTTIFNDSQNRLKLTVSAAAEVMPLRYP